MEGAEPKPPLRISPSRLGRYFYLECARMLRYSATPEARREADGVPGKVEVEGPVAAAILEGGYVWEEAVVGERLPAERVLVGPVVEGGRLRDRHVPYADWVEALRAPPEETVRWIYQAELKAPPSFYTRYGLDPSEVIMSDCRPDLIALHPDGRLEVIDIKASREAQFAHLVQAALYMVLLREVVAAEGITEWEVDTQTCGIWLAEASAPEACPLPPIVGPLEAFVRGPLPGLLRQEAAQSTWSVALRCEWCEYLPHCVAQARRERDLSILPAFPPSAKRFLEELPEPVRTLEELKRFLEAPASREVLRRSPVLVGRRERLLAQMRALEAGRVVPLGGGTVALTARPDVEVVIGLHRDPLSGSLLAAGVWARVHAAQPIPGVDETPWGEVAEGPGEVAAGALRRAWVARLSAVLEAVHRANEAVPSARERSSLQCYVFGGGERALLDELLLASLEASEDDDAQALALFFHFQSEGLAQAESHPRLEVPFPLVVVEQALRRTVALPVVLAERLPEVSATLRPRDGGYALPDDPRYTFPLSNRLRTDAVFDAWFRGGDAAGVREEVVRRLRACGSVVGGLREVLGDGVVGVPAPFSLPLRDPLRRPTLSRLAYITRYEEVLRYLEVRGVRALTRSERLESGTAVRVRLVEEVEGRKGSVWWAELTSESQHVAVQAEGFGGWVGTPDTVKGDLALRAFPDFAYRASFRVPSEHPIGFVWVEAAGGGRLKLRWKVGRRGPELSAGRTFLLHPRYTDWTSQTVLDALARLDDAEECPVVDGVEDPGGWVEARGGAGSLRAKAALKRLVEALGVTPSQEQALRGVLERSLAVVWGPPGTGKTHFLGVVVCALAALREREGRGLTVLISGFTHAAIEHCLATVAKLAERFSERVPELSLVKLGAWKGGDKPKGIKVVRPGSGGGSGSFQVVGGTVYAVDKLPPAPFDVVIVDEGSQLRVAESLIPLSRVAPGDGHLVVAGDDLQLGPILKGRYPTPPEGRPQLAGSVFSCLREPDREVSGYTHQLLECFRLNDVLCALPAEGLYGSGFRPATSAVAERRLGLVDDPEAPEWVNFALDPAYPLVLITLEGVSAAAENTAEAALVAELVLALRARLIPLGAQSAPQAQPYEDDAAFWREGVFVVSPHHVQIRAIVGTLTADRVWSVPPFVDTVEKMQGREAQAVVVSYGIADSDTALREGEFIYSLNRLNVALTRAQSKAVVCLPAPLLSPPLQAFGREELRAGIHYMRKLERFVDASGSSMLVELGAGIRMRIRRTAQASISLRSIFGGTGAGSGSGSKSGT